MKTKNLIVEDWTIRKTLDLRESWDVYHYSDACTRLYPDHIPNLAPTCDHCGQQNLRYVTLANTKTFPEPNNWARIGSSCYNEWFVGYLKSTNLFHTTELTKFKKSIVQTGLNKTAWVSSHNGYFWGGELSYKQLIPYLQQLRTSGSRLALISKPWVVCVYKKQHGNCDLQVKLSVDYPNDPNSYPANIRAFLELAPQLRHGEVISGLLSTDGLGCEFKQQFSHENVEKALEAFKRRLHMHLLVELKDLIESTEYSPWRASRLTRWFNHQAAIVESLGTTVGPKLESASAKMLELLDLIILERQKDAGFNDWLSTQIDNCIEVYMQIMEDNPEQLTQNQIICLTELARREKMGEL